MDNRLKQLVNELSVKFGLEHYKLERYSFFKKNMYNGEVHYICDLELMPIAAANRRDPDFNPSGTAVIEYNVTTDKLVQLFFVNGQSFSTHTVFNTQTVREVAHWIEQETGYRFEKDFTVVDTLDNGYQFKSEINGLPSSPSGLIEVEFDSEGKLTSFLMQDMHTTNAQVLENKFTLTIEELETIIQKQIKFVQFPNEDEQKFIGIYGIDEVYIHNDTKQLIPSLLHERVEIIVNQPISWSTALEGTIERKVIDPYPEVSIEEAFTQHRAMIKATIGDQQIQQIESNVTDVLRTILPNDSNKWTLATIRVDEQFIEVICTWDEIESTYFNRKFVVLLDPVSLEVLNYIDNGELFEIFDSFTPAPEAVLTKEEAYQKLAPFITLTPTYVYDFERQQFELCGFLNATHAVEAVTGEIIPLDE